MQISVSLYIGVSRKKKKVTVIVYRHAFLCLSGQSILPQPSTNSGGVQLSYTSFCVTFQTHPDSYGCISGAILKILNSVQSMGFETCLHRVERQVRVSELITRPFAFLVMTDITRHQMLQTLQLNDNWQPGC